ncbi:hypothetical protein ACYZUA_17265 [Pseudomonas sp. LS2P72]
MVAADLLNWQEDVGAVSAGRYADMIAVDGDPVADISILEALPVVMKGGAIVLGRVHSITKGGPAGPSSGPATLRSNSATDDCQ